jgi:cysteine desulfurase
MPDRGPIYLDYNATTPCDPRVVEAMLPYFQTSFANPASVDHRFGREAHAAVETARKKVAASIGARSPTEVFFLSGATEANNLALKGLALGTTSRRHLITQTTEHRSVLEPLSFLAEQDFEVTVIGVDSDGLVNLDELESALRQDTLFVSVMAANSETGVLQPIAQIARIVHNSGALMHCDAAQLPGKLPISVTEMDVDLLSLSAHKVYGPKGVGALYRRRLHRPETLVPVLHGGGQESGLRSGTVNVPGAVGFAEALLIASNHVAEEQRRLGELRDRFEQRVLSQVPGCYANGGNAVRLPNTSNLSFEGVEGKALLAALVNLGLSSGSACSSSSMQASRVLTAMGMPKALAEASIRCSLGRPTTIEEIDYAAEQIGAEVARLRSLRRTSRRA